MLMAVKNQIKVTLLSIKYATMREMLNKTTFLVNIIFMIINNASFIIQWIILYSLKNDVGGYTFKQVLLLWGIAASVYGLSHFAFQNAFSLSDTITNGKLDAYLVQPKSVLISVITSKIEASAIGDMIYGLIMLFISGVTIPKVLLFILFTICGGTIITAFAIINASLSFWFSKSDMIADTANRLIICFDTYPEGIFKGLAKIMLFTIIPVGFMSYFPVRVMTQFDLNLTLSVMFMTVLSAFLAFWMFYKGLKKYSSSNLMLGKI